MQINFLVFHICILNLPLCTESVNLYCSLCFTVRLHGTNSILESYSSDNQMWLPVCAENWDNNYGRAACEDIGYSRCRFTSFLLFMSPSCRVSHCFAKVSAYSIQVFEGQTSYCCWCLTNKKLPGQLLNFHVILKLATENKNLFKDSSNIVQQDLPHIF